MTRGLLFLSVILLAGCQAGVPASPRPTGTPGIGAATTPPITTAPPITTTPAPLASAPVITVTLVGDEPVIVRGDGPPDHAAVMPAATAVDADGSVVAFLVWFGSARGDQLVTVARSSDGIAWTVDPDPIYTDLGMATSPPGPIPGAALRAADGTWLLYGWAAAPVNRTSFATWRATAPGPDGPWSVAAGDERVLPRGPIGAWDDQTAAVSAVLPDGPGYAMWYEGQRPGSSVRGGIGYATSDGGTAWARLDDPVLGPGDCGPASAAAALGPQVWRRGDGYLMLFGGSPTPDRENDVLAAVSDDGINWTCNGEVLLRAEDIPGSKGIHTIQGATLDGQPVLLVESLIDNGSEIWLATVSM